MIGRWQVMEGLGGQAKLHLSGGHEELLMDFKQGRNVSKPASLKDRENYRVQDGQERPTC